MDDILPKQMSSTDTTPPLKEEQAHCNDKTLEKQPKNINDNKCIDPQNTDPQNTDLQNTDSQNTDSENTDSENTDSEKVYSMRLNNEWQLYVML
ncbi:pL60L [African swine fever virus]|nr:pL60L [African swine fever virus]